MYVKRNSHKYKSVPSIFPHVGDDEKRKVGPRSSGNRCVRFYTDAF